MPPKTTDAPRARAIAPDFVAAQGVAGVDADADDVAGLDRVGIEGIQRLVADDAGRRSASGVAAAST